MPIVRIDLLEGRAPERKLDLIRRVTEAVVATLGVRSEQVRVLLTEIPAQHWAIGGETMADRPAALPGADEDADPS
jgi:4-oxalocrotonate tautomerase